MISSADILKPTKGKLSSADILGAPTRTQAPLAQSQDLAGMASPASFGQLLPLTPPPMVRSSTDVPTLLPQDRNAYIGQNPQRFEDPPQIVETYSEPQKAAAILAGTLHGLGVPDPTPEQATGPLSGLYTEARSRKTTGAKVGEVVGELGRIHYIYKALNAIPGLAPLVSKLGLFGNAGRGAVAGGAFGATDPDKPMDLQNITENAAMFAVGDAILALPASFGIGTEIRQLGQDAGDQLKGALGKVDDIIRPPTVPDRGVAMEEALSQYEVGSTVNRTPQAGQALKDRLLEQEVASTKAKLDEQLVLEQSKEATRQRSVDVLKKKAEADSRHYSVAGFGLGFEQDENGQWTLNPTKAALGVGAGLAMTGLVGNIRGGMKIAEALKRIPSAITPEGLKFIDNRVSSEVGKKILADLKTINEIAHTKYINPLMEDLRQAGVFNRRSDKEELFNSITDGKEPEIQKIINQRLKQLKEIRPDMGDLGENYLSNMPKEKYSDALKEDFSGIIDDIRNGVTYEDRTFVTRLERSSEETKSIVADIREQIASQTRREGQTGRAVEDVSVREAVIGGFKNIQPGIIGESRYTKTRPFTYSDVYREKDVAILHARYIESTGKMLAEAEVFGSQGEKLKSFMGHLKEENDVEYRLLRDVIDSYTGSYQTRHQLVGGLRKASDIYRNIAIPVKLATATIPNLFQTFQNSAQRFGFQKTAFGWLKLLREENREYIRHTIGQPELLLSTLGHDTHGFSKRFAIESMEYSGMTGINRLNFEASAFAAEAAIKEWVAIAQKGGKGVRVGWAKNNLKHFDVDYTKPLTRDILNQKMFRAGIDTQLMRNVFNDPLWMSNPKITLFTALKTFGVRMAKTQKDILFRDAVIKNAAGRVTGYNPRPLLQLAATGIVGGNFASYAQTKLREITSGKPQWDRNDRASWEGILDAFARAGSVGIITDVTNAVFSGSQDPRKSGQMLERIATPVVMSDIGNVAKGVWEFIEYTSKFESVEAGARAALPEFASTLGMIPFNLAKRVQTDAQKIASMQAQKNGVVAQARSMVLDGNGKDASALVKRWNEQFRGKQGMFTEDVYRKANRGNKMEIPIDKITGYEAVKKAYENRLEQKKKLGIGK